MRAAPALLALAVALASTLPAQVALAQQVSPPATPGAVEPGSADFDAGRMLFAVGDFSGALIKFGSAYAASGQPRMLWNMAACENKLHHYARSLGLMRRYLKDSAQLSDQDRADAEQAISAMGPLTSTTVVTVDQPGATVWLDDEVVGHSPLEPVVVDIGVHKVRASKADFQDAAGEVTVTGGAPLTVRLLLVPIVHQGRLHVHAGPRDTVVIDGGTASLGSWSGELKSGGHTLRVSAPDMLPYQAEVLVLDAQSRDIDVVLQPVPGKGLLPTWAWIVGGVVVAGGVATGMYFVLKPTSRYEGPTGNVPPGLIQADAPVRF